MPKLVRHITDGGTIHAGQTIFFRLEFADGSTEDYEVPELIWPKMVDQFRAFGQLAEELRKGQPEGVDPNVLVQPYVSASTPRTGVTTAGEIGMSFSTQEGVPVSIVMSRSQARQFANKLKSEVLRPAPKPSVRN